MHDVNDGYCSLRAGLLEFRRWVHYVLSLACRRYHFEEMIITSISQDGADLGKLKLPNFSLEICENYF